MIVKNKKIRLKKMDKKKIPISAIISAIIIVFFAGSVTGNELLGNNYETNSPAEQEVFLVNATGNITDSWKGNNTAIYHWNTTNWEQVDTGNKVKAIQRAVDNATSESYTVIVGEGTYNGNLNINNNNVKEIIGYENKPTIDAESSGSPITINTNDVTVKELNVTNSDSDDYAGIRIESDNATITNNTIINNDEGVYLDKSSKSNTVNGNEIKNNSAGVYLSNSSYNNVSSNEIINNSWMGVYLYGSSNNNISVNNITSNDHHGLFLGFSSNNNTVTGNNISDNAITGFNSGIRIRSSSNNFVTSNNITSNNYYGVNLVDSSDNRMHSNKITKNDDNGIQVSSSSKNFFTSNNVTNNKYGVELYDSSSYNTVSGNRITNNSWEGVEIDNSSDNNVSSNEITNNDRHGVYLHKSSKNNTINSNEIENSNPYGVYLSSSSYNIVTSNEIENSNSYGVYLSSSSNNTVTSNEITNNTKFGVYLRGASDNNFSGNSFIRDGLVFRADSRDNTFEDNTVNGDALVFLKGKEDLTIEKDIGQLVLIETNNITISNKEITETDYGIYLAKTNNTKIQASNITKNYLGIHISNSNNTVIQNSNISENYGGDEFLRETEFISDDIGGGGISLFNNEDTIIESNKINKNNYAGIFLYGDNKTKIQSNNITHTNNITQDQTDGSAILIGDPRTDFDGKQPVESNNINIKSNSITNNVHGVSSSYLINGKIQTNKITNNSKHGVWLSGSQDIDVTGNNIRSNNNFGVYLFYQSSGNRINANRIAENNEVFVDLPYGLSTNGAITLHYASGNNNISENIIKNNHRSGFLLSVQSAGNIIKNNNVESNDIGVYLFNSNDNTFYLNNFIGNEDSVTSDSDNSWVSPDNITYIYNGGEYSNEIGNYWDDIDTSGQEEGIWNTAYTIEGDVGDDEKPLVGEISKQGNKWVIESFFDASLETDSESKLVGLDENASYNLTVMNTGNLDDSYDLVVSSPRADAFLNKDSINLAPGESKSVNLNVSSDSGGNFEAQVSVISTNSGQKETITTTTQAEYYGLTMSADSTSSTIKPGNEANYTLTIKNTGNRQDTYNLEVTNTSLSPELSTSSLTIPSDSKKSLNVTLSNQTTGIYTAFVNASSTRDTSKYTSKTLKLNVEKEDKPGVALSLDPTTKRVERNGEAAYTVKVKNTGNVKDTYSLSTESDTSTSLGTNSMTLSPGESSTSTLTVSDINEIKTYATSISVTANNYDVSSSETVYTKGVSSVDISASPGSRTTTQGDESIYTIRIKNTGIKTHDFKIEVPEKTSETTAELSRTTINDLEPGQTDEITLTLNNTKSLEGEESRIIEAIIKASVSGSTDKSDFTSVSSLYSGEEVYGVSISSNVVEQAVKPGKNATYLLTVQNLGNTEETIELSKSEKKGSLEKKSLTLSASGTLGDTKVVKFPQSSSEEGEVVITADSGGVTDSLTLNTRVAKVEEDSIVNSDVDDSSTVTNSKVNSSTVLNSEISDNSKVNSSIVTDSSINNTVVRDSDLTNVKIRHGIVENNLIKKGIVKVDGTVYELTEGDEAVTVEELVSSEEFGSNIVGSTGEKTQISSQESNITLSMNSEDNYVGGSMKLQRSNNPPADVEAENTNTSQYLRIKPSVDVEESTKYQVIKLSYTNEWLEKENIDEDTVAIYRYDENNKEWVELVEEGDPSFCNGVERNLEENYVKANVTKFSTYQINGENLSQEDPSEPEQGDTTTSSGTSFKICQEDDWECTEWSECTEGSQIRDCERTVEECIDVNDVEPAEVKDCKVEDSVKNETEPVADEQQETKQEADIRVLDTNVPAEEGLVGTQFDIEVELLNQGDAKGTKTIPFAVEGETKETRDVTLQAGESTTINFTHEVRSGKNELFVAGEKIVTVRSIEPDRPNPETDENVNTVLFNGLLVLITIVIIVVLFGYRTSTKRKKRTSRRRKR